MSTVATEQTAPGALRAVAGDDGPTTSTTDSSRVSASPAAARAGSWRDRFPARPVASGWAATECGRAEVLELVNARASALSGPRVAEVSRRGLPLLLDWLADQPGRTWQQRWLASGADPAGEQWAHALAEWLQRHGRYSADRLALVTSSLMVAVGADIVRPSLFWLLTGGKKRKVARNMIRSRDPEGFARLEQLCQHDPAFIGQIHSHIQFRTAVIIAAKGGALAEITAGDVLEVLDAERELRGRNPSGSATFRALRELGILGADVPTLREIRSIGQCSVEELVDRYPIGCRPVRDLLVDYLKERQPAIDYGTLRNQSFLLAKCFWQDLEQHHPGIDSLRLSGEAASAWKQRLRRRTTPRSTAGGPEDDPSERLSYLDTLAVVRAFYLDLAQWALEDPGRWAPWVVPCPITQSELSRRKAVRRRKARMDARTRERLPVLPVLIRAAEQWRTDAHAVLTAGRATAPGDEFTAAGQTLVRSERPHAAPGKVWAHERHTGVERLLSREEEHAFWAWAIIEVLRLTGLRAEELLELSHYSLVQYRLPTTGELVPLLQIAPSKTDTERLLVVSPELADVLSTIICRVRGAGSTVPLVRARDRNERVWLAPSPLLFQHRLATENHGISATMVASLLDEALAHTGLVDGEGSALQFTPHDFRRLFITDAILHGLPPHIAQVIAGHQNINVTVGYKAVYPEEAINAHLAFLARRRGLRPSEEYRTPTDDEWQEFLGHFERRKVSTGNCGRAFGTPCIHEHACIRCSMLWPDPGSRDRLVEIRDNLTARITEAQREGWLGEVEGLQVSLAGAEDKIAQIDRRPTTSTVDLGLPTHTARA